MTWFVLIPFVCLIGSFIIKIPIGWGMLFGSIVYFLAKGIDLKVIINTAGYGVYSSYILIAIPLFIFAANIMNSSKVTEKIFSFANSIVGRFKGGTAYVNIIASLIFAGMTGSALADAAGLGLLEIEQMKKEGYDAPFSCALTGATAVIGPIFPPSIPFVVFAMISGASVGKLFIGGILPAILLSLTLGMYVCYISNKRGYPCGQSCSFVELLKNTVTALPALFTPVILLIGIYTGVMTPTEAGAVAALYAIVISKFIYKTLGKKDINKIILDTITSTGNIFLIIAAAYCFSYIISIEQVATSVCLLFEGFSGSRTLFLILVNIVFIVLGCFIDVNISELVFIPIFIPIAQRLGIDMVQFGVMLCLNMMIGLTTPPFGMLLFVTAGVGNTSLKEIIRETIPMLVPLFAVLIMVTFIPEISLFLPKLLVR